MQDCFREHPDVYGAELADEDEAAAAAAAEAGNKVEGEGDEGKGVEGVEAAAVTPKDDVSAPSSATRNVAVSERAGGEVKAEAKPAAKVDEKKKD